MGMLARRRARLELLECMQLFVVTFAGMVKFSLGPGAWSGRFETWCRSLASEEKPTLCWGLFSIEVDNEVLDFERDWDCRENTVGGDHRCHAMVHRQGCVQRGHTKCGGYQATPPGARGCSETPCWWHNSGCTPSTTL